MLNQEEIHRYFNHLSGAKRIEFLYGLLYLCQPLELRYLGTCLEEIARKDYEYLYHAEQKTNSLSTENLPSSSSSSISSNNEQIDITCEEKLDLTNQFARAHAIVDIALLWAKNRPCAIRLFRRLKTSESIKLVDLLLERDDLDERTMDEILIIFCLASNHPAFSFDMRIQMSQIFKELEKRQRKIKLLQTAHNSNDHNHVNNNNNHDEDDTLDESISNTSRLSVHASPLLTRLAVVNFDMDSTPIRVLIKADWSDNNSTLVWKTINDIRSFHLQLSNIVYHDEIRLERLMSIASYLREISSTNESDHTTLMKKNISIYMAHLVYFSSYISTISTLAKFFNSSLKLVDSKHRLFNSSNNYDESLSSSPSYSNGLTPLQCELTIQQQSDSDSRTLCSPKLSVNINKSKQHLDVAKQARSIVPTNNGTQTGLEVRCEETQTDRIPGPGFILAEHQDYLRRYSMDELANLTPNDLILDGLDSNTAQLLCSALDDLKPMSIHLSNAQKLTRSSCNFIQMPLTTTTTTTTAMATTATTTISSSAPSALPPLLDAALMTVVQQQQQPSRTPPPGFDRNQYEHILINFSGVRSSHSSSPSPKLPKTGTTTNGATNSSTSLPSALPAPLSLPPPPPLPATAAATSSSTSTNGPTIQSQHHVPLLTAHSFLYNPVDPCIFPIAIPPGFPSTSPDFMRLFAPNMAAVAAAAVANTTNPSNQQTSVSNSRSAAQSNGTNTPPEHNGQNLHPSSSSTSSNMSRHQQSHYHRHKQLYASESYQFQQNSYHSHPPSHHNHHHHHQQQQRQSQTSYPQQQQQQQQQHNRPKACYTCGDIGHLAFACPEQYLSDSTYVQTTRDGYKLDYRPRQSTPTNIHQQQRQIRSNSKTKGRDNS